MGAILLVVRVLNPDGDHVRHAIARP